MKRAEELKSLLKPQASAADCDTEDIGNFQHISILLCTHLLVFKIHFTFESEFFLLVKLYNLAEEDEQKSQSTPSPSSSPRTLSQNDVRLLTANKLINHALARVSASRGIFLFSQIC